MTFITARCLLVALVSASLVAACGGGGQASIGGSVSGLAAGLSVALQDNGSDSITVTGNQSFVFPTDLGSGAAYDVTVSAQPVGQTCSVVNAAGVVDSLADDVTNVSVSCATTSSVGGTVSGLAAGTSVTLLNRGQLLSVAVNGPYAFAGTLPAGATYDVTVAVQPVTKTCAVSNPTGAVVAGVQAIVVVTCN